MTITLNSLPCRLLVSIFFSSFLEVLSYSHLKHISLSHFIWLYVCLLVLGRSAMSPCLKVVSHGPRKAFPLLTRTRYSRAILVWAVWSPIGDRPQLVWVYWWAGMPFLPRTGVTMEGYQLWQWLPPGYGMVAVALEGHLPGWVRQVCRGMPGWGKLC